MDTIKKQLFDYCQQQVEERIARIQEAMQHAHEASNDDTKSSAGDKYETGREMMQLELNKNQTQLKEAKSLQQVLSNIKPEYKHQAIQLGSLVHTDMGMFYIGISLGKATIAGNIYFLISPAAPIGKSLLGKKEGDKVTFNGKALSLLKVQ